VQISEDAELPEVRIESVSAERMQTMAVLLQDPNPIHLDAREVQRLGMGDRVVNQGPANMGYVANVLLQAMPGATLERFTVRFLGNVFAEDTVIARARVDRVEELADGRCRASCTVSLAVEGGDQVLSGTASAVFPVAGR